LESRIITITINKMKNIILVVALLLAIAPSAQASTQSDRVTETNVFVAVNGERATLGIAPLERSEQLDEVAQAKLDDIVEYRYWSHNNPVTGATPWTWFKQKGYDYKYAGENLADGFNSLDCLMYCDRVLQNGQREIGWVTSPTHYSNIKNANYTQTGIAIKGRLVVQVFAVPTVGTTTTYQVMPTGI
jgi:uncharacterized protein YkwD